jgi:outer membrane protein OmpA-like peptidoglycan-associated protein
MRTGRRAAVLLAATLAAAVAVGKGSGWIAPVLAESEADKRKNEQERQHKPGPAQPQQKPPPQFKAPSSMPPRTTGPQSYEKLQKPEFQKREFQKPEFQKRDTVTPVQPYQKDTVTPGQPYHKEPPPLEKPAAKQLDLPPKGPATFQKQPDQFAKPPSTGPVKVAPTLTPGPKPGPLWSQGPGSGLGSVQGPKRFDEVQKSRVERFEGGRKVIEEPGNRFIVKDSGRAFIRHDESERFLARPGAKWERRPDGSTETFYVRPDGTRIVSVVDANGRLLRRYRRDRDGREHSLFDNRRFYRNVAIGVGIGALGIVALNLALPHVTIPPERYIVDYGYASDDDLYEALDAPPVEVLDRAYSLEEVLGNYELRARMRRVDLDTILFEFGSWEVPPDQYDRLERIARAILRVLRDNPDAVFLIEGHTDAVGSDEDNLSLSDRRAASVAQVLTGTFGVPPENLVTQGYGEQYLKIDTQAPEPRNRRVTIVNITPLMSER